MNENEIRQAETVEETTTTENTLATVGQTYEIGAGTSATPVFSSFDTTTPDGKKKLYNYTNRPDYNISDFINKPIDVVGIYVDVNSRVIKDGENAGMVEDKPRTILVDVNGKSYIAGVSIGVYTAVREIIRIFGHPATWGEPLRVMPVNVKTPKGNMLSLEIV